MHRRLVSTCACVMHLVCSTYLSVTSCFYVGPVCIRFTASVAHTEEGDSSKKLCSFSWQHARGLALPFFSSLSGVSLAAFPESASFTVQRNRLYMPQAIILPLLHAPHTQRSGFGGGIRLEERREGADCERMERQPPAGKGGHGRRIVHATLDGVSSLLPICVYMCICLAS